MSITAAPTPSEIIHAVKEVSGKVGNLTADDIGAATLTQVNAAIQSTNPPPGRRVIEHTRNFS